MLAERRPNEESSILRLQSSFPIASCGVVAWRWSDELSTLSVQNVDRQAGGGLLGHDNMYSHVQSHTSVRVHPHMQTLKGMGGGKTLVLFRVCLVINHFSYVSRCISLD